jgi:predicted RNA-binding Zn-ribbon protein involved in translation (DUF1610 family)
MNSKRVLFCYTACMGKWLHRLTEVNLKNKTASCSSCGDNIRIRTVGRKFRCRTALNTYRREFRRVHGGRIAYHEPNPGVCSICSNTVRVSFDHNHTTGKFRGWLCINCNTVLGLVHDDSKRLRELAEYLEI